MDILKEFIKCSFFVILFSLPIFFLDPESSRNIFYYIGVYPFRESVFWNFFAGFGTIVAIFITYTLYRTNEKTKEKAKFKAIIDEIYANLNIGSMYYTSINKDEIQLIISELNKLTQIQRYPNPTDADGNPFEHDLFSVYEGYDQNYFFEMAFNIKDFFSFKNVAISQAMATEEALILSKRIFLNLGHLDYSIKRMNMMIERWNSVNKSTTRETIQRLLENLKREYFVWLHFRMVFTLIDILRTYPSEKIYDQDTLKKYKDLAGTLWEEK